MSRRGALLAALVSAAACSRTTQVRESERKPEAPASGRGAGAGVAPRPGRPRVPAAPQGLLAPGAVARIQRALVERGLLKGHREGALDDATTAAIRRLQAGEGLAATGFPDRETMKELGIDPEHAYVGEGDRERAEGGEGERKGAGGKGEDREGSAGGLGGR